MVSALMEYNRYIHRDVLIKYVAPEDLETERRRKIRERDTESQEAVAAKGNGGSETRDMNLTHI